MFLVLHLVAPVDETVFHDEGTAPAFVCSKRSNRSSRSTRPLGSDGLNVLNILNALNPRHGAVFVVKFPIRMRLCRVMLLRSI